MAKAMQQATHQRGFSCAQIAVQKNGQPTLQHAGDLRSQLQRRRFVRQIACKISTHE